MELLAFSFPHKTPSPVIKHLAAEERFDTLEVDCDIPIQVIHLSLLATWVPHLIQRYGLGKIPVMEVPIREKRADGGYHFSAVDKITAWWCRVKDEHREKAQQKSHQQARTQAQKDTADHEQGHTYGNDLKEPEIAPAKKGK